MIFRGGGLRSDPVPFGGLLTHRRGSSENLRGAFFDNEQTGFRLVLDAGVCTVSRG